MRRGAWGVGSIHHLAWRVDDAGHQLDVRERIDAAGRRPTPVIDRFWFQSVYFLEPGGVLFELATDGPGFAVDEDPAHLGESLVLPPWLESNRQQITALLPKLQVPAPVARSWRVRLVDRSRSDPGLTRAAYRSATLSSCRRRPPLPARSQQLRALLGARASDADAVREHHSHGESYHAPAAPDIVCFPASTAEVSEIARISQRFQLPIVPFGAGTSLEGHVHALRGGISIDLREMNRVLRVSDADLDATVEAGVTRLQLAKALRNTGLMFPIDPGADATLGGMAATRASGTTAVRYGTMRENVLGLTVVLADGKIIKTGTRARKSAAGYDLTRLFVGSEGTLGIITEVTLRLHPVPEAVSAAVCSFHTMQGAVDTVIATIQLGVPVARIELLDETQMDAINRYSKTGARGRANAVVRVPRRRRGARRAAGRNRRGAGDGTRRPPVRMGDATRGSRAAVAGAAQRALRRPGAASRLPLMGHRCLRAHLPSRRLCRRNRA